MRYRPDGLSPNAWAVKAGVSRTIWQDLRRHGNPSRRTLEKLLGAAGSSLAEFEALRVGHQSPTTDEAGPPRVEESGRKFRGAGQRPVPLVRCSAAGQWAAGVSQIEFETKAIVDHLPRPASLANDPDAYALTVPDNNMWPRFRPGRHIAVSPASAVEPGDDVVVIIVREGTSLSLALLKQFEGRSLEVLQLRQFTPDLIFEIPAEMAKSVHKVLGELI